MDRARLRLDVSSSRVSIRPCLNTSLNAGRRVSRVPMARDGGRGASWRLVRVFSAASQYRPARPNASRRSHVDRARLRLDVLSSRVSLESSLELTPLNWDDYVVVELVPLLRAIRAPSATRRSKI